MRNFSGGLLFIFLVSGVAHAGSAVSTVAVSKSSPLRVVTTGVTVDCSWAPGTVVLQLSTLGGDGTAVTYSLDGTLTGDLVISGSNLIVGSNGIAIANCGKVENLTINASQP